MHLNPDESFIVKRRSVIYYCLFYIFLLNFSLLIFHDLSYKSPLAQDDYIYLSILGLLMLGFLVILINGRKLMEINKSGIFYNGKLITNFSNFVSANITDQNKDWDAKILYKIQVEFYKADKGVNYHSALNMKRFQNKSKEEIISAIQFFQSKNVQPAVSSTLLSGMNQ